MGREGHKSVKGMADTSYFGGNLVLQVNVCFLQLKEMQQHGACGLIFAP